MNGLVRESISFIKQQNPSKWKLSRDYERKETVKEHNLLRSTWMGNCVGYGPQYPEGSRHIEDENNVPRFSIRIGV